MMEEKTPATKQKKKSATCICCLKNIQPKDLAKIPYINQNGIYNMHNVHKSCINVIYNLSNFDYIQLINEIKNT